MTPEQKLRSWGDGPWVNEPDLLEFEIDGIKCRINRVVHVPDGDVEAYLDALEEFRNVCPVFAETGPFGGHLCGYVRLPLDSPLSDVDGYENLALSVHGGLTWEEIDEEGYHWVGFDCAHSHDIMPSMQAMQKNRRERFKERYSHAAESRLFDCTYRDIEYVRCEIEALVAQVLKANEKSR